MSFFHCSLCPCENVHRIYTGVFSDIWLGNMEWACAWKRKIFVGKILFEQKLHKNGFLTVLKKWVIDFCEKKTLSNK